MSEPAPSGEDTPCPREVWAAARRGGRVSVTIQPDGRSMGGSGGMTAAGDVTAVEKVGDAWTTYVTLRFVPDGELAPVELEAEKSRGEWDTFRAFHWREPADAARAGESLYMYVGRVVELDVGDSGPDARDEPEDAVVGVGA